MSNFYKLAFVEIQPHSKLGCLATFVCKYLGVLQALTPTARGKRSKS